MTIIVLILSVVIFLMLLLIWKPMGVRGLSPVLILGAFVLKMLAGISVWYVYTSVLDIPREDADIFKYYDDGAVMASAVDSSPSLFMDLFFNQAKGEEVIVYLDGMSNWERSYDLIRLNDNRTMIRVHAVLHILSGGHFLWHLFVFNVISFLGLLLMFKGVQGLTKVDPWCFMLFVLPPSLLFWCSAPLKEAMVLLPLGVLLYAIKDLDSKGPNYSMMLFGLALAVTIKPYVCLALMPAYLFLLSEKYWKASLAIRFLSIHMAVLVVLFVSQWVPSLNIISILSWKQSDFIGMAESVDAGSLVMIPRFDDMWSFLVGWPKAVWLTFFRPGLWEIRSSLDGLSAVENSIYLLLILCSLLFRKKNLNWRMILFCLSFLIGMGVFIGSVTPVLGASVRYRSPALPFLLLFCYLLFDTSYLGRFFSNKSIL